MNQSENINELAAALSKAQGKFGHIMKDKEVKFDKTNYSYADLAGCFDACREVLSENGLSITQLMQQLGNGWVVVTKLMHSSGQWINSVLPISIEGKPQDIGSRITYMRKYQLWSILGLATEDDDGQSEDKNKFEESQKTKHQNQEHSIEYVGDNEIIALSLLIENLDDESSLSFFNWIKKTFSANSLQDIPKSSYEKCMVSLNAKIKYLKDQEKSQDGIK
jgi:hypothetical protein